MSENTTLRAKGRPMLQWEGKTASLNLEYYPSRETEVYGDKDSTEFNKIFWWDNFQVLSHLLKDYKGKIDLIYIDPPFDSKADYVKKIKIRWKEISGWEQSIMEEKQYGDIWGKDEYLQFMHERLLLLRELLSDTGSIYLHCDWHKAHHLRCLMDEIFGENNFLNEIIWENQWSWIEPDNKFPNRHNNIFAYRKWSDYIFNRIYEADFSNSVNYQRWANYITDNKILWKNYPKSDSRFNTYLQKFIDENGREPTDNDVIFDFKGEVLGTMWYIKTVDPKSKDNTGYPTQKPEWLLERIIKASSNSWDIVLDCFMGSGTTCAVAQRLGRRWIGCDINTGAIQTTTKRLLKVVEEQRKNKDNNTPLAFKVHQVNEYNIFKNKDEGIEAYKTILLEAYGVDTVRGYFDGKSTSSFVKVIDPNRLLSKKDIDEVLKNIDDEDENFILSKSPLRYYDVEIICSGRELDIETYTRKTNTTQIKLIVRDILIEKEGLIFKEKPTLEYTNSLSGKTLSITLSDFISPVLLKKLDIDNKWATEKTVIEDFKSIIDSVAIDIDYDGELFNAEIIDTPSKKQMIQGSYEWEYKATGKQTIAIKIIDILWEELFETFDIEIR
jgi:site-specific DNA-methyltransferase (adenine-specific)